MKKILLLIMSCLFFSCKGKKDDVIQLLEPITYKEKIAADNVQLIDVRTPEEYAEGKIAEATNINYHHPDFKKRVATLNKDLPIAVYCKKGGRSGKAAKILKELGFKEIYDLDGGIVNWQEQE